MSEPLRVAVAAEGPTDAIVLQAILKALLRNGEFVFQTLQPEGSAAFDSAPFGRTGAGWAGVYRWIRQAVLEGGGSVSDSSVLSNHDLLIVQVDADVAGETYANGNIGDAPNGVHVFTGRAEALRIEDHGVVIHGISFSRPQAPVSLLPKFKAPVSGCVNIGLLHTSLSGAEGHDTYAPCSVADLIDHGFDYWCLGHVHKRQVHARSPCTVVMPGIPQGRHINEAGPKSVTLATVGDDGEITIEERITSIAQFERIAVDVTGLCDWTDVLRAVEVALGDARGATVSDHLIARIEIAGTTPLVSRLRRYDDLLLEEARQAAASLPRTAVEKVSVVASPPIVPGDATDYDPVEELRGLIEGKVLALEEFRSEVRNIVGDLQRQLPPELRDVLSDGEDASPEMIARIVREGGEHVLARLGDTEDES